MSSTTSTEEMIALDRDNLLRIYDGEGIRVTTTSGVLWITEEHSANDTVLLPGDSHAIQAPGLALVQAHRTARVVLELPAGATAPRRVDFAFMTGATGYRLNIFPTPWRAAFHRCRRALAKDIHKTLLRLFVARTQRMWRARDGSTCVHPFPYY